MNEPIIIKYPRPHPLFSGTGDSISARAVNRELEQVVETKASAEKKQAICSLYRTFEEGFNPGWDGYNAKPIDYASFASAHDFLRVFPQGRALPEISAYPTGEIVFDWYHSPSRQISVCFQSDRQLVYAAKFADGRIRGRAQFSDQIPDTLLSLILKIG
jgi:hypothetical protein